ncbi:hypothetical protein GCM10009760_38930 [Kitasatospora kazusensis]|uniref:MFS transporter n=1 Tax=Kitasatospora kazusensis TaxID=407974 RepID=A0ABN2ZUD4_9ACTN
MVQRTAPLPRALLIANVGGALLSVGSSIAGLLDPGLALAHGSAVTAGVDFYAQAYAARAVPLGAALVQQLLFGRTSRALTPLLLVSGVVQLADAAIGLTAHNPGMVVGGSALAVLHLATAARLTRTEARMAPSC